MPYPDGQPAAARRGPGQAPAGRHRPRPDRGIRPEHLKDAALVGAEQRAQGLTFQVLVEVLEWLGAEELAYFRVQGARTSARELEELAADSGSTDVPQAGDQLVAHLDPASRAREGEKLELWVDPHKAQLFNPQNGAHLTL
jgi:multiple sugar transport system ATP-binding protein